MGVTASCLISKPDRKADVMPLDDKEHKKYSMLFENNRRWVAEKVARDPAYFITLSKTQAPKYLWIGCSDSRAPPNHILGLEPGELFVYQNISNVVSSTDFSVLSAISYAVRVLGVEHIIVCGHTGCGGVKASLSLKDNSELTLWIRHINDVYRLHMEELHPLKDKKELLDKLIELNAIEQSLNVLKNVEVQQSIAATGAPKVHACIYDVGTGIIKKVHAHLISRIKTHEHLYDHSLGVFHKSDTKKLKPLCKEEPPCA